MTKDSKKKIATDALNLQYRKLKDDYDDLFQKAQQLEADNKKYRKQNAQYQTIVDTEVRADLEKKILAKGDFKKSELEDLETEQLQTIAEVLSKSRESSSVYKPIRAGDTSETDRRLTVGNLYGKTRAQIIESGGEF